MHECKCFHKDIGKTRSSLVAPQVKDPELSLLGCTFDPCILRVWQKKKKKVNIGKTIGNSEKSFPNVN